MANQLRAGRPEQWGGWSRSRAVQGASGSSIPRGPRRRDKVAEKEVVDVFNDGAVGEGDLDTLE